MEQSGQRTYGAVGAITVTYGVVLCVLTVSTFQKWPGFPGPHWPADRSAAQVLTLLLFASVPVMLIVTGFGLIGLQAEIRQKVRAVVTVTAILLAVKAALAFNWPWPPPSQSGKDFRQIEELLRAVYVGIPSGIFALILAVTAARMGRPRSGGRPQVSPKEEGPETAGDSTRLPGCAGPILGAILVHPLVFVLGYLYGSRFGYADPYYAHVPIRYGQEGGDAVINRLVWIYLGSIFIPLSMSVVGGIVGAVVEFGLRSFAHGSRSRKQSSPAAPGPAADRPPN